MDYFLRMSIRLTLFTQSCRYVRVNAPLCLGVYIVSASFLQSLYQDTKKYSRITKTACCLELQAKMPTESKHSDM